MWSKRFEKGSKIAKFVVNLYQEIDKKKQQFDHFIGTFAIKLLPYLIVSILLGYKADWVFEIFFP